MRPQDIVILLKVASHLKNRPGELFFNAPLVKKDIASELGISPAEVTESLNRSSYAGLYDATNKKVRSLALMDFLQYGLKYVFPQQPGALVRGIPTAHSAKPLSDLISSNEVYVWPNANGLARGQAIEPLYHTVETAIQNDERMYELLALTDAVRVGKSREASIAIEELKKRILSN
ncbi:hypothetical protein GJJ30_26850 [Larkinella terrae]|uniref:Uncharacterized protein n=2 Tax=Larkinella terrae TaxID=2025311 RepID=A0A7K0ETR3_9BACT|nr:hypothetical protein [Larkinella terrae]